MLLDRSGIISYPYGMELKLILILNLIGLIASFVARKLLKKGPVVEFMPYVFLYIGAIFSAYYMMKQPAAIEQQQKQETNLQIFEQINTNEVPLNKVPSSNENVKQDVQFYTQKVTLTPSLLKFGGANPFENSTLSISILDSNDKVVEWVNSDKNTTPKFQPAVGLVVLPNSYNTPGTITITNNDLEDAKLTFLVYLKADPAFTVKYDAATKVVLFTDNKYWLNSIVSDCDSIKAPDPKNGNLIEMRKSVNVKAGSYSTLNFNLLTGTNQITKIAEYEKDFGMPIKPLLGGNAFTKAIGAIFYNPFVKLFEFIAKSVGPLVAMFIIIVVFKLLASPINYQGYGFGKEFQRVLSQAVATKNQDAMRTALFNNKNLNIKMKVISFVLKLAFFMIFWRVFNNSPLFYGTKFLWINNLALADSLNLGNGFGLIKQTIPALKFVSNLTLLSLVTSALFFFEMQNRNKQMPQAPEQDKQSKLTVLILLLAFLGFSSMPSVFYLYLIINSLLDKIEQTVFENIKKSARKKVA